MKTLTLIMLGSIVFFTVCKKEVLEDEESNTGTISFHFHHMVGMQPFAFNTDYTDDFGNTYQWTRAEFYLRAKCYTDHDGNRISNAPGAYALVDPTLSMADMGTVKATTLHNVIWGIGLDSATNHIDPSTYSSSSPLANQSPSMHWGWSTYYIFAALEGKVDIDSNGTYDAGETFTMHVGTDALYNDLGAPIHIEASVPVDGTGTAHLEVDYGKFIEGIDLSTENLTHTNNNIFLATKVSNNFANVLKVHN